MEFIVYFFGVLIVWISSMTTYFIISGDNIGKDSCKLIRSKIESLIWKA
jgi:hypothetical protein